MLNYLLFQENCIMLLSNIEHGNLSKLVTSLYVGPARRLTGARESKVLGTLLFSCLLFKLNTPYSFHSLSAHLKSLLFTSDKLYILGRRILLLK